MKKELMFFVALVALVTFVSTVSASCYSGTYVNNYRCSGNWIQRLYQYSDGGSEWRNIEYCDYGCSGASCLSQYYTHCSISADVATPDDVRAGETIYTTITLTNDGDRGGYTDVTAYLCESDNNNCRIMDCDGTIDPRIYISGDGSYTLTCSITESHEGDYIIEVDYNGCDYGDQTIYSDVFSVYSKYVYHRTSTKSLPVINAVFVDEIQVARDISKSPNLEEVVKAQVSYQTLASTSWAPVVIVLILVLVVFSAISLPSLLTGMPRSGKGEAESCSSGPCEKSRAIPLSFDLKLNRREAEHFTNREC